MSRRADRIKAGTTQISTRDSVMRELARTCAPLASLRLQSNRFAALVNATLSQQISVHAARAIRSRLLEVIGPGGLTAGNLKQLTAAQLRSVGISNTKATYLKELAVKVDSGELNLKTMGRWDDVTVIEHLTAIKGVGVWTAQMFLIFSLGRLDVLPDTDHGVRTAIQRLYALDELPDAQTLLEIARPWRPYATIASWYCWRSHELAKESRGGL